MPEDLQGVLEIVLKDGVIDISGAMTPDIGVLFTEMFTLRLAKGDIEQAKEYLSSCLLALELAQIKKGMAAINGYT